MKEKTTLKSILGTCLLASAFFCYNTQAQTIFSENFSGVTTGDNTTLTGSETPYTATHPDIRTAWRSFNAGGAIRLGNGNSSANLGYIQTRNTLDLSQGDGNFILSFDVKGWTTVENQILVLITGMEQQLITYTATMDQPFETITLNYTGGLPGSTLTIETTEKRAFIDNVVIKRATLGTPGFTKTDLKYYPNPVKNVLHVSYAEAISSVSIFNLLGQKVLEKELNANEADLDLSALNAGNYFARVHSGTQSHTVKIIKQ